MDRAEIETIFAHWAQGDWRYSAALFAEDAHFTAAQPEGQVESHGRDGVASFMRGFLPQWDNYTVRLEQLEERGQGRFIAVAQQHGVGRESRTEVNAPAYIAITARGGEIVQLEFFFERDAAEAALDAFA